MGDAKISIELLTPSREKRENKFLIRQINERIKKLDDECLVLKTANSTLIDRIHVVVIDPCKAKQEKNDDLGTY